MQNLAPIALFVYNRPDHTRRTLKFLKENILADESRLFIFSDAAANPAEEEKVREVRELIKNTEGFKTVEILERKTNLGLANSIISGVSKLVQEYGKVIVLEDDLITSPYTLQYFNDALIKYERDEKVMHIGAYMYPLNTDKQNNLPETFFYRAATSWGWATWHRAWNNFEPDIEALSAQFDSKKIHEFSIENNMNFWKQMKDFKSGKNNSWAIRWYASIFLKGGLTLNPSQSLVNNIGHDGSGVHSGLNDIYNVVVNHKPVSYFPELIEEHPDAYLAIKHFLKNRKGSLLQRLVRYIKQKLNRN
ncbi:glycosyltransferase [Daejeonella oryzae]|uniref:glycosyltransferase n=1 Tax=Daejeonella oryzae TaxID=1122943 RepID=UPI0003F926D5|nr:glycosyltransferase [Daejeonella oryzae]